jgi:capsular polysaccharide biosynthesis protein
VQSEARLAGLKAQLAEMEKALGPVTQAQTLTAIVAAQREELKHRMERATSQADQLALRLQEARITGVSLQARILSRAEPAVIHPWSTAPWWTLVLAAAAMILVSLLVAWIVDSFDRPVYDDDDFANMTGAPPVQSRAAGAGGD